MVLKIRLLFFILCSSLGFLFAQDVEVEQSKEQEEVYRVEAKDTISIVETKLHSPKRATIYEALVPGLGHIYNKKAWHVPITYAALGTTIYFISYNSKNYKKYKNAYADFSVYKEYLEQSAQFPLPIQEPSSQRFRELLDADYESFSNTQLKNFKNTLKNRKDSFRRYRDLSYISLAAVYVLNVIWATVDAHFFYYDVSDDLSMRVQPQILVMQDYKQGVGVNVVFSF